MRSIINDKVFPIVDKSNIKDETILEEIRRYDKAIDDKKNELESVEDMIEEAFDHVNELPNISANFFSMVFEYSDKYYSNEYVNEKITEILRNNSKEGNSVLVVVGDSKIISRIMKGDQK